MMSFRRSQAQAVLEYFILFSIIILITLISLSTFFPQVKKAGEEFFQTAVGRITK